MATIATSCGGSDSPANPNEKLAPEVSACSVSNGASVATSTTKIEITYSQQIVTSSTTSATLNGTKVSASASGYVLTVPVTLDAGTQYTLSIPKGFVIGAGTKLQAEAYTLTFSTPEAAKPSYVALVNANATTQTKNVYNFLIEQNGKKIVTGAMANVNNNNDFSEWVYKQTGKYPAINCYDFIHLPYSGQNWIDYSNITPAKTWWQNNGLVSYMWHWLAPSTKEQWDNKEVGKYSFNFNSDSNVNTDFDIREALKTGTWQHDFILADIDQVASYLKLLQDNNIPVIWRPLHEAAGDYTWGPWFWWGRYGVEYTKQLWQLMYDRLVNYHKLNNLIWVWTAQTSNAGNMATLDQIKAAYPGNEYVDIVGVDLYPSDHNAQSAQYHMLLKLTEGKKLITLSEVGMIPDPEKSIAAGDAWSWFTLWYTNDIHKGSATTDGFGNTATALKSIFTSSKVITRDSMPSLK
jgi:mannan endo-1,4-beta-mannosidase